MQESLLNSLCAQRSAIHARWDVLLRTERVTSPLAYPDALVHLIEWALDQIFAGLRDPATRKKAEHAGGRAAARPDCPCGRNPLLAFFLAGEQALLEALVLEQAAHLPIDPSERDTALNQLYYVIRAIARREVDAFCSVCQHRLAQSDGGQAKNAATARVHATTDTNHNGSAPVVESSHAVGRNA